MSVSSFTPVELELIHGTIFDYFEEFDVALAKQFSHGSTISGFAEGFNFAVVGKHHGYAPVVIHRGRKLVQVEMVVHVGPKGSTFDARTWVPRPNIIAYFDYDNWITDEYEEMMLLD